jgi:predicted HTH domain antitoxin
MSTITLEYPPAWLAAMGLDAPRFAKDARVASAMKLFECGRLSSGQAAQFAGMGRVEFLLSCRQWGVSSVDWDADELKAEFSDAQLGLAN